MVDAKRLPFCPTASTTAPSLQISLYLEIIFKHYLNIWDYTYIWSLTLYIIFILYIFILENPLLLHDNFINYMNKFVFLSDPGQVIVYATKPTNQTYQTKPHLPNQTYQTKPT